MTDDVHHDHAPDWDALERDWRGIIERSGWMVIAVGGGEGPPFQYTVGLTAKGLPEVIVYGLPQRVGHGILNHLARRLVEGERFADGAQVPELVEGDYRVELWDVTWLQDPLGAAYRLYGESAVRARQLVLPDRENRMPWADGFADGHREPVLFTHPSGVGPRPAVPLPDAAPEPVRCDAEVGPWTLPVPPHSVAIATSWVVEGSLPVLAVTRFDDGDWAFADYVHAVDTETSSVLCLHHLVDADPTLGEPVSDLEPGMHAFRDAVGAPWQYEYAQDEDDEEPDA